MRARAAAEAGIFAAFAALALLFTWPLGADWSERTLWGVDPLIDLYTVHWLTGHLFEPTQLFGGNIFHPTPHAVLFSDLSLGTAALVWPLRASVSDPLPLYNASVLVALAFGGWAFQLLVFELTRKRGAAFLSGMLAAFGSHQLFHLVHLNLLTTGWIALFLLGLHRLVHKPGPGSVALSAVSFALSALSSGYYAVGSAIAALVFAAWHWRGWRRRSLAAAAAAALFAALLIAPYARAFIALRGTDRMQRGLELSSAMAFDPTRDLTSHGRAWKLVLGSGGQRLFPGLLPLVLGVAACVKRRPHAGFYAGLAALLLVISVGPRGPLYPWLFALPPLDSMRHPYTFAGLATLLLAVLAGLGWAHLRLAARPWALPLALGLAVAELWPVPPRLEVHGRGVPEVYEALARLPAGPALEVPVLNYQTLLWAARHGMPVLNGQGAFAPRATLRLKRAIESEWLVAKPARVDASTATRLIGEMGGRYVILPTGRWPGAAPLADAFGASRRYTLVAEAAGDRLYELRPAPASADGRE